MACGSANTITGVDGEHVVGSTRVARLMQWAVNPTLATSEEWGDSDTAGYSAFAPGRKTATFTTEGKFDTSSEVYNIFDIGDNSISVLWMNNTLYWDFPCSVCNDFNLTVNVDTQEVVGWTSAWNADGIFYKPGASPNGRSYPS